MKIMNVEEARAIVHGIDPAYVARLVWRAADDEGYAVGVLGLASGSIMTITWPIGDKPPPLDEPMVILMVREPGQQLRTRMRLSVDASVPPSDDVIEADVLDDVRDNEDYYAHIEEQFRLIYSGSA